MQRTVKKPDKWCSNQIFPFSRLQKVYICFFEIVFLKKRENERKNEKTRDINAKNRKK